jgi:hypothetical protein
MSSGDFILFSKQRKKVFHLKESLTWKDENVFVLIQNYFF